MENGERAAGIKIGGIPIGDPQYINVFLSKKAADVLSLVNKDYLIAARIPPGQGHRAV